MSLTSRIMHEESVPNTDWISVHEFFAAMCELAGGALTKAQIETYYNMSSEDIAEFDALTALSPNSIAGRMMLVDRVHSIFILAEHRAPGYETVANVKAKITAITFPAVVPNIILIAPANNTWTNQPSALTEFLGNAFRRLRVDLTNADKIRLVAGVTTIGATGARIWLQYSTDLSAWATLTTNQLAIDALGHFATAWEVIPAGARGDIFIRAVGQGGNGAADPVICEVCVQTA